MKKLFRKKKKSTPDNRSLASGRSAASGYTVETKKDLPKLHKAVLQNDIVKLKISLKKADVNQLDKENRTALHLACALGNPDAVRALVNHPQCNLNLCDNERRSALMKCVQCQFKECLEILLHKEADVNLSDINGNTALHLSAAIPSLETCCLLLENYADVHHKNKDGSTPLHIAVSTQGSKELVLNLLEDGAQVNAVDNNGKTPLILAASHGYLETVKLLLANKADAAHKDAKGWSADDYADMSGHHPISMIIIEHAQKQKKMPGAKSSSSMGDHIYATVSRSNQPTTNQSSSSRQLDQESDLSFTDESDQDDQEKSDDDLQSTFDHGSTDHKPEEVKPKVNVAQFLKQRQFKKELGSEDDDASKSNDQAMKTFGAKQVKQAEVQKSNFSEADGMTKQTEVRSRGHESNSRRGGPVSPAKPPLPTSRSPRGAFSSPALAPTSQPVHSEDEDSPWDSEEEEDVGDHSPSGTSSPPHNQYQSPNRNMMAELGLSEDDIKDIYGKSSGESAGDVSSQNPASRGSKSDARKTGNPSVPASSKKDNFSLDDSDADEVASAVSSAWDDDESTHKSTRSEKGVVNYLAQSSVLKFDDETSDVVGPPESKPSDADLANRGVLLDSADDADASSSSWDSEKVKQTAGGHDRQLSGEKNKGNSLAAVANNPTDLTDESELSDEEDVESESSWEVENRRNRQQGLIKETIVRQDHAEDDLLAKEEEIPEETRRVAQKTIAMEAMEKVKRRESEKRKEEERLELERLNEKKRKEERLREEKERLKRKEEDQLKKQEEDQLLASQDRKKIEAALQEALDRSADSSESEASDLDDSYMGNIASASKKMGDARKSFISSPSRDTKTKRKHASRSPLGQLNGVDPATWTGTETESEDVDDLTGRVPASLRSSQLSESLRRSGEKEELEREATKERRRAVNAIEQLDYARRNIDSLMDEMSEYKKSESDWIKQRDEMEASVRKLNFEQNRLKEQLSSSEVELKMTRERFKRVEEQLQMEEGSRRKQEITIRELQNELKISEQTIKMLESEKENMLMEQQQASLRDKVLQDRDKTDRGIQDENTHKRHLEALNLLMQEKDQELIRSKAEKDALQDTCQRYKDELSRWHNHGDEQTTLLGQLNEELNEKVNDLTFELRESEAALQQAAMQYNMQISLLKQANESVTNQIKREQTEKENAIRDLEVLNEQQKLFKRNLEETEEKYRKEENKVVSLEVEMRGLKEKCEEAERKLHSHEVSENLNQQEANSLRSTLTHKESLLIQSQRDLEDVRERIRRTESELNEFRRENAKLSGRIEMLQTDVTQQESDRVRLRHELEEARNLNNLSMTNQHGKLSEMMTANHNERLELEKMNAKLHQEVSHFREEIQRLTEDKMKKDEELALAQQDRIETHKHLSFTESSMAQLTESQRQLQEDRQKLSTELDASRTRCTSLENRMEETNKLISSLRNELESEKQLCSSARRDLQVMEMNKIRDKDDLMRLEDKLKDAERDKEKLQMELDTSSNREKDVREHHEMLKRSRRQLEELVAKLQDEKVEAVEKMKTQTQRAELLQTEADGHRKMWEEEIKARSKITMEYTKADKERNEAMSLLEAYKDKLTKASTQSKSYRTKYENQRRYRTKLEDKIDYYSKTMAESKLHSDTSESECENKLSRMSEKFEDERSRLDSTIHRLQKHVLTLDERLRAEARDKEDLEQQLQNIAKSPSKKNDSFVSALEKERDELREELRRAKSRERSSHSPRSNAAVNAELNAKLGQVNNWLEEKAKAQDILERLRFENEEKRVADANHRANELKQELDALRSHMSRSEKKDVDVDEVARRQLQQVTRENIALKEKLLRTKQETEDMKTRYEHERKKHKQLQASFLSGAIADFSSIPAQSALPSHTTPSAHSLLPSQSAPLFSSLSPGKSPAEFLSSTPRKDISYPTVSQLRNRLDASIAMKLTGVRPPDSLSPTSDASSSNQRRPDETGSRPSSNEYFLVP